MFYVTHAAKCGDMCLAGFMFIMQFFVYRGMLMNVLVNAYIQFYHPWFTFDT